MAKQIETNRSEGVPTQEATPFRRMLVAVDESPAGQAAAGLVAEWVGAQGAEVRFVQVSEERSHGRSHPSGERGPLAAPAAHRLVVSAATRGARSRQLVHGLAEAAQSFDADVIVLGLERSRLAGHRLAPSLRDQIVGATDLPVLVAPSPPSDGKRHEGAAPDARDEERTPTVRRYAHV
ncbi:MAG TPA: universal stress protein [Acidimicrobiales bacterium]|jgi:nucleotide-binding universal stress UspA family protein|nr:universal stress protein [Acidimicrobiales bacterium]